MEPKKETGFTKTHIIIAVVVAIVLLAAALIPAYIGIANNSKDIDKISDQLNEQNQALTLAEIEEKIAEMLANATLPDGVTEAELKAAIDEAVKNILASLEDNYITEEKLEAIIKDILENQGVNIPKDRVEVSDFVDLNAAISDPYVDVITLVEDITLTEETVVERDVVIDLNGNSLKAPKNPEYPESIMLTVSGDAEVTVKNGVFVDPTTNLNGGMDFFCVAENGVLNLENVSVTISVTAEVIFNNTLDRWQTNSATHRIFVLGNNATVNLKDTDITVIAPKTSNINNYARYRFSVVGVHFARNSADAKFVMDGGSFTMQVTDPNATKGTFDYTDSLYFVKSERETGTLLNATNTVELKGDAKVVIGAPNEDGELNTTNNLFYLGAGYSGGKTYYSGVKTVSVGADVAIDLNGVRYGMDADGELELEDYCQELGSNFANKKFDSAEEIKYHFACSDYGYGCTFEGDFTLSEAPAKCPQCGKGSLVIK